MGYNELEIELRKTLAQISRWREMGYLPVIEQGIALGRLQKIYAGLLDMPCSEPEAQLEGSGSVRDTAVTDDTTTGENTGSGHGEADRGGSAPDDESFEACCDPDVRSAAGHAEAADDDDFADLPVKEGSRLSEEAHMQQEFWSQDPCPSPTEFPEAISGEKLAVVGGRETDGEEVDADSETAERTGQESGLHDPDSSSDGVAEVKENVDKIPEQPRIFGIEVSPYARHEIIDTLFHGNAELFEAETAKLNDMDSLEQALVYIGETYRWIPENAATIKFIDLLETRFEK